MTRRPYTVADLPMGGCATAAAHYAHLDAGSPVCQNGTGNPAYRGSFVVHRGQLAYLDTFAGLVPVKVTAVDDACAVTVKVTAARRGYDRGEILAGQRAGRDVVPRTAVFVRSGQYRIAGAPVRAIPDSELAGGVS